MASPSFGGFHIFDSVKADGSLFPEGCLWVPDFNRIKQTIHFNGEDGNWILDHGAPDRGWVFQGKLSAPDLGILKNKIRNIENFISLGERQALVDSFGNTWTDAQVQSLHISMMHKTDSGYVSEIQVNGIIRGMQLDQF